MSAALTFCWCPGGDSNSHAIRRYHLKIVCLPIPPPGHELQLIENRRDWQAFFCRFRKKNSFFPPCSEKADRRMPEKGRSTGRARRRKTSSSPSSAQKLFSRRTGLFHPTKNVADIPPLPPTSCGPAAGNRPLPFRVFRRSVIFLQAVHFCGQALFERIFFIKAFRRACFRHFGMKLARS